MNHRENYLRAATFRSPEDDPNSLDYCDEMAVVYRKGLEGQVVGHPLEGA
jgi:hypothetical protein